ncbi:MULTISPECIES: FecR family protein [Rheinheimera]|uniref:FecR family protein n=1 Tax=Rheinheimera marina TaxID=1774958 RepID=A0ABV9JPK2_9GAMM
MKDEQQIFEQAAAWVELQDELSPAQQRELDAWLAESELHRSCYLRCLQLWRSDSLTHALARQVVTPAKAPRRWQLAWIPAAAAMALLAVLQWPADSGPAPLLLSTHSGPAQQMTLPDGSRVQLAGESQLSFVQQPAERRLQLTQGEALFEVTHLQDEQPFIVSSGAVQVRVTGTRFSVNKLSGATLVTVLQGSVRVSTAQQSYALKAGQQLKWQQSGEAQLTELAAGYQHPLLQRWLEVQDMPLGELLEQLDRYLPEQILLPDAKAAALPVSGRFDLQHPLDAVHLAAAAAQLKVSPYAGQLVLRAY